MSFLKGLTDSLFGPCVRRISSSKRNIFLTFDDGPITPGTSEVLQTLKRHGAQATFFLVADRASANQNLVAQILSEGHAIGNHSPDHRYRYYFGRQVSLEMWIAKGEEQLQELIGQPTVGFRPPAGVRTPKLGPALKTLNQPLIMWHSRFYDATWAWTESDVDKVFENYRGGEIVLLHDRQKATNLPTFLATLDYFLDSMKARGFSFDRLNRTDCLTAMAGGNIKSSSTIEVEK